MRTICSMNVEGEPYPHIEITFNTLAERDTWLEDNHPNREACDVAGLYVSDGFDLGVNGLKVFTWPIDDKERRTELGPPDIEEQRRLEEVMEGSNPSYNAGEIIPFDEDADPVVRLLKKAIAVKHADLLNSGKVEIVRYKEEE